MREEGLVTFRREAQTLWYRIADPRVDEPARDCCIASIAGLNPAQEKEPIMTLQTIDPAARQAPASTRAPSWSTSAKRTSMRASAFPARATMPLSRLDAVDPRAAAKAVIFHCRSGARTAANAPRLAAAAGCEAYILEGGIDAWKKAGLPVATDRSQPIEIMRQVQIAAGCLVLLGVVLGVWSRPAFLCSVGFVGAGLVFAGISGLCGMAQAAWPDAVEPPRASGTATA